ncbi:30S ribosomal protein S20 [candidate division KSB1 bacterium]|nr:30S ribosomal protein S20 [candidate division KSB1 bacterium]
MPQHKSAEKRVRQSEKRRQRNVQDRSQLKSAIKKVRTAPDAETASNELKGTVSLLDKLAGKGIIHKNKAANLKSKLTRTATVK